MATSSVGLPKAEHQRHKRLEGVRATIDVDGGYCAEQPPRTAVSVDGAALRFRAAFLHLMTMARRHGNVACLKATCRQLALASSNSYC